MAKIDFAETLYPFLEKTPFLISILPEDSVEDISNPTVPQGESIVI